MTSEIDAIKKLNSQTGIGLTEAKKALVQAGGDYDKAYEQLRVKGLAKADKKMERTASSGLVHAYVHGGKIGVLVELCCETDFVARTEDFKTLANDLALHVAAANPQYISVDYIPTDLIEKERQLYAAELKQSGKPDNIIDQIVDGKLDKYYSEVCLMRQGFIKDPDQTIEDLIKSYVAKLGENIVLRRFSRLGLGEQ